MEKEPTPELYRAAARTFEELAFLLATEGIDESQAAAPLEGVVCVDFEGAFAGCLVIRYCGNLAGALAANMLGLTPPIPAEMQEDALREVANVICGNFLPEIAGQQAVFRLSAPRLVPAGYRPEPDLFTLAGEARIGLEGGLAHALYFLKEPRAAAQR